MSLVYHDEQKTTDIRNSKTVGKCGRKE